MYRRISIVLEDATIDAVARLARAERRDTRDQLALIVEQFVATTASAAAGQAERPAVATR
jgi:hypothetical protein